VNTWDGEHAYAREVARVWAFEVASRAHCVPAGAMDSEGGSRGDLHEFWPTSEFV
jgi:hypothetical protein